MKNKAVIYKPKPDAYERYGYGDYEGRINLIAAIGLAFGTLALLLFGIYQQNHY